MTDLSNPIQKYPAPPFKRQSQPWPGLAGKMDPPPDHGEKSYRGSGRLTGRKALITGGLRLLLMCARAPMSPSTISRTRTRMRRRSFD
jgi:hypothetical protein